MRRRQFLGLAASGGIGATAGCMFPAGDSYATLQSLHLTNPLTESVTVDVRIERDDTNELAYLETHEILTDPDMLTLDCVWPDAPLTVMVQHVDGERNTLATSDYEDCLGIVAEIRKDGPSFVTHNSECPIRTAECHTDVAE